MIKRPEKVGKFLIVNGCSLFAELGNYQIPSCGKNTTIV